jgi:cystathionine gamma-synthase
VSREYTILVWPYPGREIALRQQSGFGAMVGVELASAGAIRLFLAELRPFSLAESLDGVESLIAHPDTMTHASITPEARAEAGILDTLLRLSVGIEDAEDLVEDLRKELRAAGACGS